MKRATAIIIGAGPAGLTAAYELLDKTEIVPIVLEMTGNIGGLSKTVEYKGNRIDIGGHRFFSRSERIMTWWQNILPLQGAPSRDDRLLGRSLNLKSEAVLREIRSSAPVRVTAPDPEKTDRVMLIRNRLSRIYFLRRFFNYPLKLSVDTVTNLGLIRIFRIGLSYLKARIFPITNEKSLADFFINRFGRELYLIFFKDYTEKVWGIPCTEIKPEWGAQRIKTLSVTKAVMNALRRCTGRSGNSLVETSLIEQFLYPKLGPGQLWDEVAAIIEKNGGIIIKHSRVCSIETDGDRIRSVTVFNELTSTTERHSGDYFFSSMPVSDLIAAMGNIVPVDVSSIAKGLRYRDFITVGLLLKQLKITNNTSISTINNIIPDNWIYIQEPEVKLGRLQIFNNWSPYLVKDPDTVWLGLEYFCNETDDLWSMPDRNIIKLAIDELAKIDIIDQVDVLDSTLLREAKAYPGYFGSYERFPEIRRYVDRFDNMFLIGRNGMHRYNNMDHSMLTAMKSVENIINGHTDKSNIWDVNVEEDYNEG